MQIQDGVRVYRANLANSYWHYTQQRPSRVARLGWHYRDRYNRDMRCHVREVIAREQPDIVVCNNLTGWSISAWDEITAAGLPIVQVRSEAHTSELQSLMRISYAVFCLKKKKKN